MTPHENAKQKSSRGGVLFFQFVKKHYTVAEPDEDDLPGTVLAGDDLPGAVLGEDDLLGALLGGEGSLQKRRRR